MNVTYFAITRLTVGDEVRQPGDLVPEAQDWPALPGYIQDGRIAPVLVATLPEPVQQMLLEWEADRLAAIESEVESIVTDPEPEVEAEVSIEDAAIGYSQEGHIFNPELPYGDDVIAQPIPVVEVEEKVESHVEV